MTTQSLLDFTDVDIVAAFVSAMLVFIVYMWRLTRPSRYRHDRLSQPSQLAPAISAQR